MPLTSYLPNFLIVENGNLDLNLSYTKKYIDKKYHNLDLFFKTTKI